MKNKLKVKLIFLIAIITALLCCGVTFAWFSGASEIDTVAVDGSVLRNYFERGSGTQADPFVIHTPRHLYNLAWLQNMGKFNDGQYYFELCNDKNNGCIGEGGNGITTLDMEGWVLPPIGTPEYPFIGNFNGNGITISNLTVSGNYSELSNPGDTKTAFDSSAYVSANKTSGCDIVGLFGVVGSMNGVASGPNTLCGATSYVTAQNKIHDFYVDGITVKTQTSTTLIGIVAGYVNGNVSNVGVKNSSVVVSNASAISGISSNISDYSTLGFCTAPFKAQLSSVKISVAQPQIRLTRSIEIEGKQDWGGSIDMLAFYNRLSAMKNQAKHISVTVTQTESIYDGDDENPQESSTTSFALGTNYWTYESTSGGSVTFYTGGVTSFGENEYLMLHGGRKLGSYTKTTEWFTSANVVDGSFVIIAENRYFMRLSVSGSTGTFGTASTVGRATVWTFVKDNAGTAQPKGTQTGYVMTTVNGVNYFLTRNGTSLKITTTASHVWTYISSTGDLYCTDSGNKYYLGYNISEGSWVLNTLAVRPGYNILVFGSEGAKYYLNATSFPSGGKTADLSTIGSASSASQWYINDDQTITTFNGSTPYYLTYEWANSKTFWSGCTPQITPLKGYENSSTKWNVKYINDYVEIYAAKYTDRNLVYSSVYHNFNIRIDSSANRNLYNFHLYLVPSTTVVKAEINLVNYSASASLVSGQSGSVISRTTQTVSVFAPYTYVPILADSSTYAALPENNAYMVCGSTQNAGDIRVSQYTKYHIRKSLGGSSTFSESNLMVLTRNASGIAVISDKHNNITSQSTWDGVAVKSVKTLGLQKYNDSRDQFGEILSNSGNYVYGFHFMDSTISKNNTTVVPYAMYNGVEYTDFELPVDSIDCILPKSGYINFFAGSIHTSNNSFFSLYEISRNSDKSISSIKHISQIYGDTSKPQNPYVYQYEDGTYSGSGSLPSGYSLLFDLSWIENVSSMKYNILDSLIDTYGASIFYFEIPVNAGEYAIGSVEDKDGAYIFYLDISANSSLSCTEEVTEVFKIREEAHIYPKGIEIVTGTSVAVNEKDSAAISLSGTNVSGSVALSRTNNTITASKLASQSAGFIGNSIQLNASSGTIAESSIHVTETAIKRVTEHEHNITNNVDTDIVTELKVVTYDGTIISSGVAVTTTVSEGGVVTDTTKENKAATETIGDFSPIIACQYISDKGAYSTTFSSISTFIPDNMYDTYGANYTGWTSPLALSNVKKYITAYNISIGTGSLSVVPTILSSDFKGYIINSSNTKKQMTATWSPLVF